MTHTSRKPWAAGWSRLSRVLLVLVALVCAPASAAQTATAPAPADHAPPAAAAPATSATPATVQPANAHAEPAHAQPAEGGGHATAASGADHGAAEHGAEEHGESIWAFLSRIANFVILAGGLVYLLRSPLGKYLAERAEQIRLDLVNAAQTRRTAAEELERIERRMKELPAEVDALKSRGLAEVHDEQVRMKEAAAAERDRLLEQARREIAQQLAAARRTLKQDAADLVVGIARRRVEHEITDADRNRLVDRYVEQVKTVHD